MRPGRAESCPGAAGGPQGREIPFSARHSESWELAAVTH